MEIQRFEHSEENDFFWSKMGRFFASPKVRDAVGGFMTSDLRYTWWVAFDEAGQVRGFCAARRDKKGKRIYLTYAYVLPEHRGQGVYEQLFLARQADVMGWQGIESLWSVVNPHSEKIFFEHGFIETGRKGQYVTVEKKVEHAEPV
jgi:GNAT superfamily N-acetyltransferase